MPSFHIRCEDCGAEAILSHANGCRCTIPQGDAAIRTEERAKIVAWLRANRWIYAADKIENGEHEK